MNNEKMGGTELMYNELYRRIGNQYDHLSIFNYVSDADFNKTTVFWNQLSYDQQAVQWLSDPNNVDMIDHFVFVSYWQSEKYREMFGIPGYKTTVIKNASLEIGQRKKTTKKNKVKLCYTSTPWRGLDVLIDAWNLLKPEDCELHIFSSCKIYGDEFAESEESKYIDLYNRCSNTEGVVYRGSIPNAQLRKELPTFDILAYPCIFEETSCIAVIEALSAGLRVLTSSLGALPETSEGWATIYPYLMNKEKHAEVFASLLKKEIQLIREGISTEEQKRIYAPRWSWDNRINEWKTFLDAL